MNDSIDSEIIGIVGVIIGVLLTTIITQLGDKMREKKQAQSVRTLISLEIDFNLETIKDYRIKLDETTVYDNDPEITQIHLAVRFTEMPPLHTVRDAYKSQLNFFAASLNQRELAGVFQFYNNLTRLELLRNQLIDFRTRQIHAHEGNLHGRESLVFDANTPIIWHECESIFGNLQAEGNPLRINNTGSKER
jgi:hypothetical protein